MKNIALGIMWLLGVKSKFIDKKLYEEYKKENINNIEHLKNLIKNREEALDLSEAGYKELNNQNNNLIIDLNQKRIEIDNYNKLVIKLKQDLQDILLYEETKEKVEEKEEISYITKELKSKIIISETRIPNQKTQDEMNIESLNDLLIKLLPFINKTQIVESEGDFGGTLITNQLTILTL